LSSFNDNTPNNVAPGNTFRSKLPYLLPLLFMIAALPFLLINQMPGNDVAGRYAPMAEAFASGEWKLAFHPRFGLLFPIISGTTAFITQLDGFRSCQLASLLMYVLAAYPLYGIFKMLFDSDAALKGMILYLACSHLLRIPLEGLRDSGKTLGFVLAVYGIIYLLQNRHKLHGYIAVALGSALLTMLRGDGALTALMLLMIMMTLDAAMHHWRIFRSILAGAIFLLLIVPQLIYVCKLTGYPVPEMRHAQLLKKMQLPALTTPELELP